MTEDWSFSQTTSDVDLDDFEEIDLTQLEFDEKVYDQQWAVKTNKPVRILSTPPSVIPPPPTRSYSAGAAGKQFNKSVKPQTYDDSITPNVPVEVSIVLQSRFVQFVVNFDCE